MKGNRYLVCVLAVFALSGQLAWAEQDRAAEKPSPDTPLRNLTLGEPRLVGAVSFEEALAARRSVRRRLLLSRTSCI